MNIDITPDFSKDPNGLVPAVAQDAETGDILMLAYINQEAWEEALKTGRGVYWSRSRQELWRKGDTSGHIQKLIEMRVDCDRDSILLLVDQIGAACHTNRISCYYTAIRNGAEVVISSPLS